MGTVIEFPRRPIEDGVRAGHPHATEATAPNLPAVPDPLEGEILPALPTHAAKVPARLSKPEWLGVGPNARAALRTATWRIVKRIIGRVAFELFKGIWVRLWHLLRWFLIGMGGWVRLVRWCFAADERADVHVTPGSLRSRNATRAGSRADHLAWWRWGILIVPHAAGAFAIWYWLPHWPSWSPWLVFAPGLVATVIYGQAHDVKPPEPVVAPRTREDVNVAAMNVALRGANILDKPTSSNEYPDAVHLVQPPHPVGIGYRTVFDLPASCGKSAYDVIAQRDRIAGAFATTRDRFLITIGAHEAQFEVWQASRDPFAGPTPEHPLMGVTEWDVWSRIPFGTDARGRLVYISLPFTSILVGARPRRGKSFAVRAMIAGAVLDPSVRFHVFDGKGGATWAAMQPFAATFLEGSDDDDVAKVLAELEALVADMRERARRIPESKLSPDSARDPQVDAPITVVMVDEAQRYIEHPKHGKRITKALVTLAQTGPSSGYVLIVITQRPDSDSFPSELRAVMGARFALEVMSWMDSNVILGPDMSKLGHDASKIRHRGVGIYRPDDDVDGNPDDDPATIREVRVFDTSDEQWNQLCVHGAELRARAELPAIGGQKGLLGLVVDALREHSEMSATGLLGVLPEPWSNLRGDQLGLELRNLGLTSNRTHRGRFYRDTDAALALSRLRHDRTEPRHAVTEPRRGDDGVHDGPRDGDEHTTTEE